MRLRLIVLTLLILVSLLAAACAAAPAPAPAPAPAAPAEAPAAAETTAAPTEAAAAPADAASAPVSPHYFVVSRQALPDLGGRVVNAVTENAYTPLNFVDPATGQAVGWEYDAVNEICRRLNCQVN